MAKPSRSAIERELVDRHGRTYAEELRVNLARGTPSALFKLLVAAILFSARIGAKQGVRAAGALFEQGWTTAGKLAGSTWEERVRVLDRSGYARYDERTATMLGQASELLLERYGGDLRRLREEAGRDPNRERALLRQLKGLGNVGIDIFFREVQVAPWSAPHWPRTTTRSSRRQRPGSPGPRTRQATVRVTSMLPLGVAASAGRATELLG